MKTDYTDYTEYKKAQFEAAVVEYLKHLELTKIAKSLSATACALILKEETTPEYHRARKAYKLAFLELRDINYYGSLNFKKERKAEKKESTIFTRQRKVQAIKAEAIKRFKKVK